MLKWLSVHVRERDYCTGLCMERCQKQNTEIQFTYSMLNYYHYYLFIILLGIHSTVLKLGNCSMLFAERLCKSCCKEKTCFNEQMHNRKKGSRWSRREHSIPNNSLARSKVFFLITWYSDSFVQVFNPGKSSCLEVVRCCMPPCRTGEGVSWSTSLQRSFQKHNSRGKGLCFLSVMYLTPPTSATP